MCPHRPKSQPYPALHEKKPSQQIERGDPAPLLCTDEASPGVLCPDVDSSVKERHGPDGVHPEEDNKNDPRDETPSLQGQAE